MDETKLRRAAFLIMLSAMSTVELAVKKVRKLSPKQARELLTWLDKHQATGSLSSPSRRSSPRHTALSRRKQEFKEWQDSVRGTVDWEIPRMPDDLVKPIQL